MIDRICEQCGDPFGTYPSRMKRGGGRFCSYACFFKSRETKVERVCEQCGEKFWVQPCRIKRGGGRFCSRACKNKGQENKVERVCEYCGEMFSAPPYAIKHGGGRFCSAACRGKWQTGEKNASWKGGNVKRVCEQCGETFGVLPYRIKRGDGRFCSLACTGKWQTGENSPTWKGGASFEPYGIEFSKSLRAAIRERDGRVCQICGKSKAENGRALECHHIDYDKENNDQSNLVALCKSCHSKTGGNREMYQAKFEKLMDYSELI